MSHIYLNKTFIGKDIQNKFLAACSNGDISSVSKLLRLHVSANTKDEFGKSGLARAAEGKP